MWKWEAVAGGECWAVDLWAFLVFKSATYNNVPSCENHVLRSHLSARLTPAGDSGSLVTGPHFYHGGSFDFLSSIMDQRQERARRMRADVS